MILRDNARTTLSRSLCCKGSAAGLETHYHGLGFATGHSSNPPKALWRQGALRLTRAELEPQWEFVRGLVSKALGLKVKQLGTSF